MAATMKDIARRTGLGLATISSYFNGGNVREKNRIKIEEAIEELHYEVNEVARGLKTNATRDDWCCHSGAEQYFLCRDHHRYGGCPAKSWLCDDRLRLPNR